MISQMLSNLEKKLEIAQNAGKILKFTLKYLTKIFLILLDDKLVGILNLWKLEIYPPNYELDRALFFW